MSNPSELKTIGLKATLPRLKILEIFQTSDHRHMSAEDVYKQLLAHNIDIGLATVYRLMLLAEQQWRRLNGRELLPPVREGAPFKDGVWLERDDSQPTKKERSAPETREKVAA